MTRPRQQQSQSSDANSLSEGALFRLLQVIIGALLIARLLSPPEASVLGETLWITQLWLAAVVVWGWDAYRRFDFRLRWGAVDAAVWLVVLGHVLSTIPVLLGAGDRRAALNLTWEWIALGCSFFLLRQTVRSLTDASRLLGILVATAVMLSAYGIWQHYVVLPRVADNYQQLRSELEILAPSTSAAARNKAAALQQQLSEMGVPQNETSRLLWENRLRSTEPFATFALANTLAGFLVAWILVVLSFLVRDWQPASTIRRNLTLGRGLALIAVLLIGYCLVLTKSRTAWVGLLAGLGVIGLLEGTQLFQRFRRWGYGVLGFVCAGVLFFAIAAFSGGFDREVISEAPKSLAYRLQYWAGSWQVVKEHPWLGTGPGNFRQHYLHYKLPESSEEIADPHHFFFDLWTSGGLLALIAWLVVLGLAVRMGACRQKGELLPPATHPTSENVSPAISPWELGGVLAFFFVMLSRWFRGEFWDSDVLFWLLGWIISCWALRRTVSGRIASPWLLAAVVALTTHLLGAGGIEMPAIVQTLLLLIAVMSCRGEKLFQAKASPQSQHPKIILVMSVLGLFGFGLCLWIATIPVWYRVVLLNRGDSAISIEGNYSAAARFYEQASERDSHSPEPLERLAELYFHLWQNSPNPRVQDFERAVRFGRAAIALDPASFHPYRRLGQAHLARAQRGTSGADAERAVEWFQQAAARYPHFAPLRAELAEAHVLAGQPDEAALEANTALALDQINHQAGHREKYLPAEVVARLTQWAEGLTNPPREDDH